LIDIKRCTGFFAGQAFDLTDQGDEMGEPGKKNDAPDKADDKTKKPPPPPIQDDEPEDGDIATPKRDRYGNDDEPL
jgi:hypothetical protein